MPADALGFISYRVAAINNHPDMHKLTGALSKEQRAAAFANAGVASDRRKTAKTNPVLIRLPIMPQQRRGHGGKN